MNCSFFAHLIANLSAPAFNFTVNFKNPTTKPWSSFKWQSEDRYSVKPGGNSPQPTRHHDLLLDSRSHFAKLYQVGYCYSDLTVIIPSPYSCSSSWTNQPSYSPASCPRPHPPNSSHCPNPAPFDTYASSWPAAWQTAAARGAVIAWLEWFLEGFAPCRWLRCVGRWSCSGDS